MKNDPVANRFLAGAEIHNSPDVKAWAETAQITKLEFRSTGVHVDHTKRDGPQSWPDFTPPGWDGPLQYTLWIFLQIAGEWHGSGCIQFWRTCEENGGAPEDFATGWYYAKDRWGPMAGHQPAPGELVGFMVTAGDARNNGTRSVEERSDLVLMPFPVSGMVYTPVDMPPQPGDPTTPPPEGPPQPETDILGMIQELRDEVGQLKTSVIGMEAMIRSWLDRPAAPPPVYLVPVPAIKLGTLSLLSARTIEVTPKL